MAKELRVLPSSVKPSHYAINLYDLNLQSDIRTFKGTVTITLSIQEPVDSITLNAHQLGNITASITTSRVTHIALDHPIQRCTIHLEPPLPAGDASLTLNYDGCINDDLCGFYRSGDVFCTQFQPSDARRAFPCFDEPAFKATFDLSVEVPDKLTALSNMPPQTTAQSNGNPARKVVSFARTPRMSSYLLAWAIGEFDHLETAIERINGAPVPVRVYTSPGMAPQARVAANTAKRVLELFEKIFAIPYPLPKMDLLAVSEMADAAMENWGLAIFRETTLLLDDAAARRASTATRVGYIIAHELAHQWFGNLVTMGWWDELWLNEGFATWAGWLACEAMYPEWRVWDQFVVQSMQEALQLDAMAASHPVQVHVADGLEVDSIFDSISYLKGASIVRMLATYLGEDVFLEGVAGYLRKHAYGSASAEDLWQGLTAASGQNVAEMVELWVKEVGFPLVTATVDEEGVQLEQACFRPADGLEPANTTWWIPVVVQTRTATVKFPLRQLSDKIKLDSPPVKINAGHIGFYRTHISSGTSNADITTSVGDLSAVDKAGRLADAMALAVSVKGIPISEIFDLLPQFKGERDHIVWASIVSCLRKLMSTFGSNTNVRYGLQRFIRDLIQPALSDLPWSPRANESYEESSLRPLLVRAAALSGDPEYIAEGSRRFEAFCQGDTDAAPVSTQNVIFEAAARELGEDAIDRLFDIYSTTKSSHTQDDIVRALGQVCHPPIARSCLRRAFAGSVTAQDLLTLTATMAENVQTAETPFEFIQEEWELVHRRIGGSMALFEPFVRASLQEMTSQKQAEKITEFFGQKDTTGYQRGLAIAVESIGTNATFRDKKTPDVEACLRSRELL